MAGASLLALIDDIATLLDDVAVLSKVAVQKTAGVLGDDLALNAQQLTGVSAKRELPVVWAVAKGSVVNKAILVPAALLLSAVLPWLVTPLLMIGGAYLCYEGAEKLLHKFLHRHDHDQADEHEHVQRVTAAADPAIDMVAFEKEKIAGAVRTDFVLSAEIIVIALGTVKDVPLLQRIAVLIAIAAVMTVGVYGLVASIIKLDDLGLALTRRSSRAAQAIGRVILRIAPAMLKLLSIVGTAAMFIVGGQILAHGVPAVGHLLEHWAEVAGETRFVGPVLGILSLMLLEAAFGLIVGAIVVGIVMAVKAFIPKARPQ